MTYGPPPPAAAPDTTVRRRNPLGVASLIVGAVPTVLGFVFQVLTPLFFTTGSGTSFFQVMAAINVALTVFTGLTAVVLGVVGLLRPGLPRAAAAAGTALGVAAIVSALGGVLVTLVSSTLY